jgi:hypothetical protein
MIAILSLLIACSGASNVAEPVNPQITDAVTVDRTKLGAFQPLPENFFIAGAEPPAPSAAEIKALAEDLYEFVQRK